MVTLEDTECVCGGGARGQQPATLCRTIDARAGGVEKWWCGIGACDLGVMKKSEELGMRVAESSWR